MTVPSRRIPFRVRLRRNRGRIARRLLAALLALVVLLCGAVVVAYKLTVIPEPHPETVVQSTVFLDEKGDYLGRRGPVDRQDVPLSQVPRYAQDAVIAAENRSFRTDSGVSPKALVRAVAAALTGGERQGGSTITQQYVKNALLSPQQTLSRKAREALIAVKLDRTRSKDQILEGYLNTVYFGRGAAGIQAAARNYFGVDTKDLTVSQGAALAAIINLPSYYEKAGSDPKVTATLQRRWEWVLGAMATSGNITAKQRAEARFPAFRFYPPGATDGQRQYLIDAAAKEAADRLGITQDQLASGGYTVHTTFDLTLQDSAAELVKGQKAGKGVRLHTAVVGMAPGDGAVRVLYGGSDYARQPFNDAVSGAVEAGTALKPLARFRFGAPLAGFPRTAAPTPLRLTSAYAAVAAGGVYATPYTVSRITRDGRTVYTAHPDRHRVLPGKATPAVAAVAAGPPAALFTTGAGGGITRRTVWTVAYDARLTLSVALFADKPGGKKGMTVPAQLPTHPSPTDFAEQTAIQLWRRLR
ncbi:penicillin-binding protein [Streptomyces yokosukanensis]|uniref:Penicillin-binding protein n=1 Tax=Streptomyces yokosukanensis TaxID=67386 RepID=A0A101P9T5_9ACTN|nr:transglycosylase domain-containing protein [Streptomyces yokosukanensis]KUN07548.1 penicillin-binding protein [Streptomyces yokosukanensis]